MTYLKRTSAAFALAMTALCVPSAVNATYGDTPAAHAPLTGHAAAARKAYRDRLASEERSIAASAAQARKTLVATVAALQVGCDASCTVTR